MRARPPAQAGAGACLIWQTISSPRAAANGGKTALWFEDRAYDFGTLADAVRQTAGGLAAIGVTVGSRVGMMMSACPDFIVFQQAVFALGAVFSPLNIHYRSNEVAHAIESCALDFLIAGAETVSRLPAPDIPGTGSLKAVIVVGSSEWLDDHRFVDADACIADGSPIAAPVDIPESALGMLLHTSATTGKSKGVMLTLANLMANYDRTPEWLGLTESTVTLCALPLYNTFGLNQCINTLMVTGGSMVLLPKFEPQTCLETIARFRCTFLPAVPTMLSKMFGHPGLTDYDLASLSTVMTGGAPVPAALLQEVSAALDDAAAIFVGYGLTEATALATLGRLPRGGDRWSFRPQSIGRTLDGIGIRIAGDDGRELPCGIVGEICLRGPNVMLGYYARPDETAIVLADAWLHTGDLGYVDDDGDCYVVDRKKDIIIRGGQNIYPAEIEEVLYRIGGVLEAAVIGQSDDVLGEVPVAFIAVGPGTAITAEDVLARCRLELAGFKTPAAVHFLPELPKGPTGKILRREVRQICAAPADANPPVRRTDLTDIPRNPACR